MSKKVALMCGHGKQVSGAWDSGCSYAGYTEAGLMLPITKAAVKYLRSKGVTVISDADNNNNKNMIADVAWANKQKCDIYVSVHCDYSKAPSGVMPLYVSTKGKKLATALNTVIKSGVPMKSRGICRRTDLYELNQTDMPACILETGAIKADLNILKKDYKKYGELIGKGICAYLGITETAKKETTTAASAAKATTAKTTETLYRVRKSWNEPTTQVGAYKSLENAKAECDKHPGYSVYGANGKNLYTSKKAEPKKKTIQDKIIDACKTQAEYMKNYTYKWEQNPTVAKSKKYGTCVTYSACVLQRVGILKSGKYIWHDNGKVSGVPSSMELIYIKDKKLGSLKSQLKKGDVLLGGNKGNNKAGGNSHIFIFAGKWADSGNAYIYDQMSANNVKAGRSPLRTMSKNYNIFAIVRVKDK